MSSDSSSSVPFNQSSLTAPTPQNTPLNPAPIASRLSRPTVADISEGEDDDEDEESEEGGNPSQRAINALMQHKLAGLIGKSSGYLESLPLPIKRRVEGLKGIATEYDKLEQAHKKELYELEKKYLALSRPITQRRSDVISGAVEPSPEEVAAGEAQSLKDDPDAEPLSSVPADPNAEAAPAGIPEFWLTALKNHIAFSELITTDDEAALEHLTDISLEYLDGPTSGYKILFHFSPNDFFEDAVLTKEYHYKDELDYEGDYVYEKAVGCEIRWKEDKNLTQEIEVKRQRNKATNRTRVIRRAKPTESFFNFFTPPTQQSEEEKEDLEDEEIDELEESLEMDYQLGQDLKERVIPRAVDYFTGKALEWEDDEDDEDSFDEDDDDEDAESDDDDLPATRRRRGAPKADNVDPQELE